MYRRLLFDFIAVLTVLAAPAFCVGDVTNGSFEAGNAFWTTVGPNSAVPAFDGQLPTDGALMSTLTNANGSLSVTLQDLIVTTAFSLTPGAMSSLIPGATEGSVLFQQFSLTGSEKGINFDWNFLTNEATPDGSFNDVAFAAIWDAAGTLVGSAFLDTFSAFGFTGSAFASHTGWLSQSFALAPNGTYGLAFGVFDVGDARVSSALLVDNVHSIPEPGFGMAFLVVAGVASTFRRRRLLA